jgi:GAF domain-containing protein
MDEAARNALTEVARLAADLGPALVPTGHDELLSSITEAARRLFGAAACSVALLDQSGEELVFHVASGAGAEDVTGMRIPASRGIAGWVLNSGQAISIEDVRRDPRFASDVAEMTGYVPGSILAMPLETDREVIGVIEVLDRRSEPGEGGRDMELLGLFARQAALAIDNSRVFADLGRVLFEALGREARDAGMADALKGIAAEAPPPDSGLAELAAHFHTLGKLGEQELTAGTRLLAEFVTYLEGRSRWS